MRAFVWRDSKKAAGTAFQMMPKCGASRVSWELRDSQEAGVGSREGPDVIQGGMVPPCSV